MSTIVLWLFMGALVGIGAAIIIYDKSGKLTVGELLITSMLIPMGPIAFLVIVMLGIISSKLDHVVLRKKGNK